MRARRRRANLAAYGLTPESFDQMLEEQHGGCAICGTPLVLAPRSAPNMAAVDHCHTTKEVRGILCLNCNMGLGRFGDDPERLRRAAAYLQR